MKLGMLESADWEINDYGFAKASIIYGNAKNKTSPQAILSLRLWVISAFAKNKIYREFFVVPILIEIS